VLSCRQREAVVLAILPGSAVVLPVEVREIHGLGYLTVDADLQPRSGGGHRLDVHHQPGVLSRVEGKCRRVPQMGVQHPLEEALEFLFVLNRAGGKDPELTSRRPRPALAGTRPDRVSELAQVHRPTVPQDGHVIGLEARQCHFQRAIGLCARDRLLPLEVRRHGEGLTGGAPQWETHPQALAR